MAVLLGPRAGESRKQVFRRSVSARLTAPGPRPQALEDLADENSVESQEAEQSHAWGWGGAMYTAGLRRGGAWRACSILGGREEPPD